MRKLDNSLSIWQIIGLFGVSMLIVNIALVIKYINIPICFNEGSKFIGFDKLLNTGNIISFISIFLILWALLFYFILYRKSNNGASDISQTLTGVKDDTFNAFGLFFTLFSLLLIDFNGLRGLILFISIYLGVFLITYRLPHFLLNPTFSIFGYHVYYTDEDVVNSSGIVLLPKNTILISREGLINGKGYQWTKLSKSIYLCY